MGAIELGRGGEEGAMRTFQIEADHQARFDQARAERSAEHQQIMEAVSERARRHSG